MGLPVDQFYTPAGVASFIAEAAAAFRPSSCVDSACGEGNLLRAVHFAFPSASIHGLDIDRRAIERVKCTFPKWNVRVGNFLSDSSRTRREFIDEVESSDLVVSNPPFSTGRGKSGVWVEFGGESVYCSVAMGHTLLNLSRVRPAAGLLAIVPESLLFSEVDQNARNLIQSQFSISVLKELTSTTFAGARVSSIIIQARPRLHSRSKEPARKPLELYSCEVIRGGLPIHEAVHSSKGVPFVHSTHLCHLNITRLTKVKPITRGTVSGKVVLIPRVGVPTNDIGAVVLPNVQLSDCVIAIRCQTEAGLKNLLELCNSPSAKRVLYKGTCAKYVTLTRLSEFLGSNGFSASIVSASD